ncbi:hypothetical protein [Mycolicibacterium baixiangningiae]|uniref:hypothetical protein n=1 Tax=Mycolicibacterium baixiangningiae TaxID=2761578 RepID=UPI0018D00954|nr:hypothetical protein [Mycolicibacterium baixiangningiae]
MNLLDEVLAAYGGADRWRQIDTIAIHQTVGGVLWPLKGVGGILDDSTMQIRVQDQQAWHRPLPTSGDIAGGSPAAHYMDHHREFDGIVLPVTRVVHPRDDDGTPIRGIVTVSVDIDDVRIS